MMQEQEIQANPIRYAFIDVSNTSGTVIDVLNFKIDWTKLYEHLKSEKWQCKAIFFYKGNKGTRKEKKNIKKLEDLGYTVRTKTTHIHRDKIRDHTFKCNKCGVDVSVKVTTPGNRKSNCDVELTVDALEVANPDTEYLIFTGDGDFAYLIEKLIAKGSHVRIISNTGADKKGNRPFSSRLRELLEREQRADKRVSFVDINDWKMKISREIKKPPSSVAVPESHIHDIPKK